MTHICIVNLTIIGSDNGLSPGRRQAIIWSNDGILFIGPLGTNFSEISIEIHTFIQENAFENVVWIMAAILSQPQCVNTFYKLISSCCQASIYYLSQYSPRSMSSHGITWVQWVNTLRLRQSECHFPDNIFKCIFMNVNVWISIKISL